MPIAYVLTLCAILLYGGGMGRQQSSATEKAIKFFMQGDSVSVAAAKAGIHSTTLIRALRQALKIGGQS